MVWATMIINILSNFLSLKFKLSIFQFDDLFLYKDPYSYFQ